MARFLGRTSTTIAGWPLPFRHQRYLFPPRLELPKAIGRYFLLDLEVQLTEQVDLGLLG